MSKAKLALLAGVLVMLVDAAQAADSGLQGFKAGDILVRGRGLVVFPTVDSSVMPIGGQANASSSLEPEADISYFFTSNISAELSAAISRHHVSDKASSIGNVDLGQVSLLSPTLTAQYHFLSAAPVSPYVGAGVNYTVYFDHGLPSGGPVTQIHYDNALGAAIQAGADFHLAGNWYINLDVKHIFLTTHVKINGGAIGGDVSINPTIVGLGIGYKF